MSRSGYNEDYEDQNVANLYRANVDRSLAGRRGQAFLRELVTALDALPDKKLIPDSFVAGDGVCALGSVARLRGVTEKVVGMDPYDSENAGYVARVFGIAECMAREIMFENDEAYHYAETDEQRWSRVRRWAEQNIRAVAR